jgi:SAM-dependent methyltransferase
MNAQRTAEFYDGLAPEYDNHMSRPGDVWVRGAFQEFVRSRLGRRARLLDFGCGTGTDAAWYAAQGYQVLAFDNSAGMIERLRVTCADSIARNEIEVWNAPYESFLSTLGARGSIDAVAANFAVINLLPDINSWFAVLARHLPVGGAVFVSALNPLSLAEIRGARSLFNALRYTFAAGIPVADAKSEHFKYWPRSIRRAAVGYQLVSSASPGTFVRYDRGPRDWRHPTSFGERIEQRLWQARPWSYLGRFVFLELRWWG